MSGTVTTALIWFLLGGLPALLLGAASLVLHRRFRACTAALAQERARLAPALEQVRRQQTQFLEGAAHLRAFFEQAAVGVAQIDAASGRILHINPRFCEILGLTTEQAMATDCMTVTHRGDWAADRQELDRLRSGETRRFCRDKRYLRPDEREVWVTVEVSALWAPGAAPDSCLVVAQDIGARKAQEFDLRRARADAEQLLYEADASRRALLSVIEDQEVETQARRASEERYRALFEGATLPMFLLDPQDGALVDANTATLSYYGYTREALLALKITDINQAPSEQVWAAIASALAERECRFQFTHRLADGELRQVEVHTGPIEVDGRTLLYSIVYDISNKPQCAAGQPRRDPS
jgi:PAS domain S-box-containing protein